MAKNPAPTEVDSYLYIRDGLKDAGWDTRNPESNPEGQVYTQNECLSNPEIKKCLVLDKPENIAKVSESVLWVIEAKSKQAALDQAISEAKAYAIKLNQSDRFQARFISAVVGNNVESFLVKTFFLKNGAWFPVKLNGVEATGFLTPDQVKTILNTDVPNIEAAKVDLKLFLSRANRINEILHLGAINPHQRASVMAALLLTTLDENRPNLNNKPMILIDEINSRVKYILSDQGKDEFYDHIKITPPTTTDNHVKMKNALVKTLQELYALNIRSAMQSGDDWLGTFYEVFLKYASWAQDLGIVLTPRHATKFVAEVMDIQPNDILYDPTCGTGGFLVAGFDNVKQKADQTQLDRFKQHGIFGIEQDDRIAALAVVNMIFRGDGKNNIKDGNCFANYLEMDIVDGLPTAKYTALPAGKPAITKVMMNPPFSLKTSNEKEYKFIEHALKQMQHGGLLFCILPYSSMVRSGGYLNWRKEHLLKQNTLLSVVTFPVDLFYPVGVTTVGVFIKKGVPHPKNQNVLWIRALNDGLLKSKGKRLPNASVSDDLAKVQDILKAFLRNPQYPVANIYQFQRAAPIDFTDTHLELVPEAYLEQEKPTRAEIIKGLEDRTRDVFAYLVKIDRAMVDLASGSGAAQLPEHEPHAWKKFKVKDLLNLQRGHFHSITALDEGDYPTISRVSTDNGLVGFYDIPDGATLLAPKTITVSTVTGDTFVQPIPFLATDNVVLCNPKKQYEHLSLASLFFITLMMNAVKWRYSYGRQCYMGKFANTEILLPVKETGELDEEYMEAMTKGAKYWRWVENAILKSFADWQASVKLLQSES